jgi:hypothetical protein
MKLSRLIELASYAEAHPCCVDVPDEEAKEIRSMLEKENGDLILKPTPSLSKWVVQRDWEIALP